jgi:hypothetical protein
MSDENNAAGAAGAQSQTPPANDGVKLEQLRCMTIMNLARQHKIDDATRDKWLGDGNSADEVAQKILETIATRVAASPQSDAKIGLGPKEVRQYSLWKALRAVVDNNWKEAGFELEASRAICQ